MDRFACGRGRRRTPAAPGVGETAAAAVRDAYGALKRLVARRVAGTPAAEVALEEHGRDPDTWKAPRAKAPDISGAAAAAEVVEAAARLMALLDAPGFAAGNYAVDLRGAQGVQVGQTRTPGPRDSAPRG